MHVDGRRFFGFSPDLATHCRSQMTVDKLFSSFECFFAVQKVNLNRLDWELIWMCKFNSTSKFGRTIGFTCNYITRYLILLWSHFTGFITCDDECTSVFADGCPLKLDKATYNKWRVATKIIVPSGTKVVAIHAKDHGGPEGILGSFSNGQVTNATWKCHSSPVPIEWASAEFDDSSWPAAVEHKDHGSSTPSNKIQNVSDDAKWIWTTDNTNNGSEVYCRVRLLGAQWSSLPSQSVQSTKTCPHSNPHMTPSTTSAVHSGDVIMQYPINFTQNVKSLVLL